VRSLFLTTRQFWPLDTGGKLRDYHLARQLAAYAQVTYVCFRDGNDVSPCPPDLAAPFARVIVLDRPPQYTKATLIKGLLGRQPANVINYTTNHMSHTLQQLLNEQSFDTIQVENVFMSGYMQQLRNAPGQPRIVTDWHNIESELMARYAAFITNPAKRFYANETARRLRFAEHDQIKRSDALLVTSGRERDTLIEHGVHIPIHVVENGVDVAQFENVISDAQGTTPVDNSPNIVFVGSMDYHANVDAVIAFASESWPTIRAAHPDLNLKIVGRRPPATIQALAKTPGIIVTGSVPDVRQFYRGAIASIVPLRIGGGTRLKILEAFAAGTPVVSTTLGAEGLAVRHSEHLLIAETTTDFITSIAKLRTDMDLRRTLTAAGHSLVKTIYDWPVVGRDLGHIHNSVLSSPRAA
jgi:polysaccharide biosynthesis protein PslH